LLIHTIEPSCFFWDSQGLTPDPLPAAALVCLCLPLLAIFIGFGLLPMGILPGMGNELKPAILVDLLETIV